MGPWVSWVLRDLGLRERGMSKVWAAGLLNLSKFSIKTICFLIRTFGRHLNGKEPRATRRPIRQKSHFHFSG
jgi:hypothetical protein